jgi:hypothetical protein
VQHDRGSVDAEHVADAREQLADQLVERQRPQRRIGDPLHRRQALRELLGLRALGPRPHQRRAFGLGALVWSPLARGFLSGKYERGQAAPRGSRLATWSESFKQFDNDRCWRVLDTVRAVARKRETTPAAVALAWLLARPEVSTIVVGARNERQLDENLRALEVKLDADDLAALDRASMPEWGYPYTFIGMREPW